MALDVPAGRAGLAVLAGTITGTTAARAWHVSGLVQRRRRRSRDYHRQRLPP